MNLILSIGKQASISINLFEEKKINKIILNNFSIALKMKLTADKVLIDDHRAIIISKERPLSELFDILKSGFDEEIHGNYTLVPPIMKEFQ